MATSCEGRPPPLPNNFRSSKGGSPNKHHPNSPDKGYFSEHNGYHVEEPPAKQIIFRDERTKLIIMRIFYLLLTTTRIEKRIIASFNVEDQIARRRDRERKFIRELCDDFVEFVEHSRHTSIETYLKEFVNQQWKIDSTNMYTEFKKVANETFKDKIHWGKIITFLSFSVSYAVYVHNSGMRDAVTSVEAWTRQVIEEDLGEFFTENGGWESLMDFLTTVLVRQRREREEGSAPQEATPMWQSVVALGTVAAGAVVAFTLRHAFQ